MKNIIMKEKEFNNDNPLGLEFIDTNEEDIRDKEIVALLLEHGIKHIDNPFKSIYVQDVAEDLNIGINKAYELFKDKDFPSINLGKAWQIAYIAYLNWKCSDKNKF